MLNHTTLIAAAIACGIAASTNLSAQASEPQTASQPKRWELHVPGGTLVQTGAQRDAIKRGDINAIQVTYLAHPMLAVTSTTGWARSRDIATEGSPKLDVFTYDIGAEVRAPRLKAGASVTFMPFAGAGAGGRSYNYRSLDVDATHNLAAYGSVGGELGVRRVRIRIEARDYVAGFKPLNGVGSARTGNDVVVMAGVRVVSR